MVSHRITKTKIQGAQDLWNRIPAYAYTDASLQALAVRFPENDRESCLLKAAALNALYNTNVRHIVDVAEHIHRVLNAANQPKGPELVNRMAETRTGNLRSFASKYAHFFLDPNSYPIYDKYTLISLRLHLGHNLAEPKSYSQYNDWFQRLISLTEQSFSIKQIDTYLWFSGMYHFHLQGETGLSKDILKLFGSDDPTLQDLLRGTLQV